MENIGPSPEVTARSDRVIVAAEARTSHATWMILAGADPKSVQGQMRHSRVSTTMEIYAQIVPAGQRRAVEQLSEFASRSNTVQ